MDEPVSNQEPPANGWWIASDGRWYPPELHPDHRPMVPVVPAVPVAPAPIPALGASAPVAAPAPHEVTAANDTEPPAPVGQWPPAGEVVDGSGATADTAPGNDLALGVPRRRPRVRVGWVVTAVAVAAVLAVGGTAVALQHHGSGPAGAGQPTTPAAAPRLPASTPSTPSMTFTTVLPATITTTPPAPSLAPPPPPGGPTLVTPAVENDVVDTTWKTFSTAFADGDVPEIEATTTPEADRVVTGWYQCGCGPFPTADGTVSFSAPPQTAYPLSFLAEIQGTTYDGQHLVKEVVFSQSSAASPWLVAFLGAFIRGDPFFGSSPVNLSSGPMRVPSAITSAPVALDGYFQHIDSTGEVPPVPSHFVDNGILKENVAGSLNTYQERRSGGFADTFTHTVVQVSAVFRLPAGDMVCAASELSDHVTSKSGKSIVQPVDQSVWSDLLPPGSYSSLTVHAASDACFAEDTYGTIVTTTLMGGQYRIASP